MSTPSTRANALATAEDASNTRPPVRVRWQLVGVHVLLILVVSVLLAPMILMLINSFKTDSEVLANPASWPHNFTLKSYVAFFNYENHATVRSFVNSVFIAGTSTAISVFLAALAAFAFAKFRFHGRDIIFGMLLATLMVPFEVTIPGLYIEFARVGWLNSYQVQILPSVASVLGVFLIRQYMLTIPDEMLDAARVDGASPWQQFWRIVVPVCSPVLGAFAILQFLSVWESYLWPLVAVDEVRFQPIMVLLPTIKDPSVGFFRPWGMVMAGAVVVTLPMVIVFLAFQRKFLESVVMGSSKES